MKMMVIRYLGSYTLVLLMLSSCVENNSTYLSISNNHDKYVKHELGNNKVSFSGLRDYGTPIKDSVVFSGEKLISYHYIYRNVFTSSFYFKDDTISNYKGFLALFPSSECYEKTIEEEINLFSIVPACPPNYRLSVKAFSLAENGRKNLFKHNFTSDTAAGYITKKFDSNEKFQIIMSLVNDGKNHIVKDTADIFIKLCESEPQR